jgi:hypothetical protein
LAAANELKFRRACNTSQHRLCGASFDALNRLIYGDQCPYPAEHTARNSASTNFAAG